jgi:hypothetical protein
VHKQLRGVTVSITRGASTTTGVTATIGFTAEDNYDDDAGFTFHTKMRDYLINVAEYKIDGVVVVPSRHDRITETIQGASVTFEVLQDQNESEADFDDRDRTYWRVHTKEV